MKVPGMNAALTGLQANANKVAVAANNIANMNTDGFRASEAQLQSMPGNQGVVTAAIRQITQPGAAVYTGNPLDMAIQGEGFFKVMTPDGKNAFTRQGNFQPDAQGRLTVNGSVVQPEMKLPSGASNITVGQDGTISAMLNGQQVTVGKLQVFGFNNPGGLQSMGNGLFGETAQSGAPFGGTAGQGGVGSIMSGSLESSNVDLASEIVNMMLAKQGYSANAKVIQTSSDMAGTLLNIKT